MNTKILIPIISMASVAVMIIWGSLSSYQYSWISVMIGGIVIVALSMIKKNNNKQD